MIPLKLTLSGFLSYRDPVEIDFTTFELACISGPNGAGKSSLLDAITWALFGQARKRDESLINTPSSAAEVCIIFSYEGNFYRVQRTLPRGKTTNLHFFIFQGNRDSRIEGREVLTILDSQISTLGSWKPLDERTLRETQAAIERTLRLDYETFVNASFFLQGNADQFTQQRPGDRKRILGKILGLDIWEVYRERAVEQRKVIEANIVKLDGRLAEISVELAEEESRRAHLTHLEADLGRLSQARQAQETALDGMRKIAAALAEQRKLVEALARQLDATHRRSDEAKLRQIARQEEKETYSQVLERAPAIEAAHAAWQKARSELERWEGIAAQFREHEKRRQGPLDEINAERARLEQEVQALQGQQAALVDQQTEVNNLQSQIETARQGLADAEAALLRRAALDIELQSARQSQANARAENPRLKAEMDELKQRIDQLSQVEGAVCPTCGQPLSTEDRQSLIASLTAEGREKGVKYRANKAVLEQADRLVHSLEAQIQDLSRAETDARTQAQIIAQLTTRQGALQSQVQSWESTGAPRLQEITLGLQDETFASEARARLAEVDAELKAIGYDAAAHDAVRRAESEWRTAEADLRTLESARAALAPLEREIADLGSQIVNLQTEVTRQQQDYDTAAASLAAAEAQAPDLSTAERSLLAVQEQENRLRLDVGGARQKVLVLDDLKKRRKEYNTEREGYARQVGQYKLLERAFSKDGVPALLIEQALPQIEAKANEILDRLSDGNMSVRFITQAAFKEKRREDLKETLDIQISDSTGTRDYEMFSGGEAFRVNFAIRLALSEVLAQRAGARLQTLIIDEGFGSQDALGRQRLVEAINLVRQDFAKILVITHIDELKDAFPTRIEVEKTERGSVVRVV